MSPVELLSDHAERDAESVSVLRFARPAMATEFEILLPLGTPRAAALAQSALDCIDQTEGLLSIYRPESELARVNRLAEAGPVSVSRELATFLALARDLSAWSVGAFDLAAGALVNAWGFFQGSPRVPVDAELAAARAASGMNLVDLDTDAQTIRFLRPGVVLNPGSMGKGWALDRAGERLATSVHAALLHGGRSSILAIGAPPGQPEGWRVGLSDPADPTRRLGTLCLRDQAMATSAATFRHGIQHGRRFGHLLDPRTGLPATGLLAATVFAPTAAVADALATAFFVLGEAGTAALCQARPELGAILIVNDARRLCLLGAAQQVRFEPTVS